MYFKYLKTTNTLNIKYNFYLKCLNLFEKTKHGEWEAAWRWTSLNVILKRGNCKIKKKILEYFTWEDKNWALTRPRHFKTKNFEFPQPPYPASIISILLSYKWFLISKIKHLPLLLNPKATLYPKEMKINLKKIDL